MNRTSHIVLSLVLGVVGLTGCGDDGPLPTTEWTPADHTQPAQQERDPRRVPRQVPVQQQTEPTGDPTARAAAALWNVSCAPCHGRNGEGNGPQAPSEMADFTDADWQASRRDEDIARVIVQGRGMMPPFGETVAPQGIAALTMHIRRMGPAGLTPQQPTPDGAAPPEGAPSPDGAPTGMAPTAPSRPLPPGHP